MKLRFLTSTPLNFAQGSGTFAGIATLAAALRGLGAKVELLAPGVRLPVYTLTRLVFNEQLRHRPPEGCDVVVGFDMDGYRIAGRRGPLHIASIKGVIADELRFERGLTRLTMRVQAACERAHVRQADAVFTTSHYAARRLQQLYGITAVDAVIPEPIDLARWRERFARNPAAPDPRKFTVLSVCRFYPRKRLDVLLEAAARLRDEVRRLEVRIVGGGPQWPRLRRIWRRLRLEDTVVWLGDLSENELAREYQRADVFCLPSVQEGFGIVFLEAMAAGKPVIAARAAAVPEVVPHGVLVEPDNVAALAEGLGRLYADSQLREKVAEEGVQWVQRFDAPKVARRFLQEVETRLRSGT
ncbi:MAG: glycosyltransferase family 4 protein [Bryobacterales bacterium]|nr:glycosyltransferase family 4 protein [Bryobacteraceae bacterium]MDW8355994.1 glycosyltransferase family 4 protein [Bryobacterales bacterium]